jgi:Second Messenger Oligonucleotide or Dinucleotide Synthetase domain
MDLPTLFSIFIRDITLTRPMRDDLIKGHKTLRERLSQDERLSKIFVTSFLQGSYKRATLVRPKGESRSDVDVVVVTNLNSHNVVPQSALDRFRPFLEQWYPGKHFAQGRSWGIELSYCDLDLVVTSAPSVAAGEMMRRLNEDSTLEDPSDWAESKTEPLVIPDREAKQWIETHPIAQLQWTREKNQRTHGNYLHVVKVLKWWRRLNDVPKYPKGYPLEHLIGDCCPGGIKSVAEGVTLTLEVIASRYASEIATGSVPTFWDRGVSQNVFKRITAQDFKAFHTMVAAAAKLARQAFDQPDLGKSAHAWRRLFGDKFPLA